jgi:hypothetical protein
LARKIVSHLLWLKAGVACRQIPDLTSTLQDQFKKPVPYPLSALPRIFDSAQRLKSNTDCSLEWNFCAPFSPCIGKPVGGRFFTVLEPRQRTERIRYGTTKH